MELKTIMKTTMAALVAAGLSACTMPVDDSEPQALELTLFDGGIDVGQALNSADLNVPLPEGTGIACFGIQCEPDETCCTFTQQCVDPTDPEACDQDTFMPVIVPPTQTSDGFSPARRIPAMR